MATLFGSQNKSWQKDICQSKMILGKKQKIFFKIVIIVAGIGLLLTTFLPFIPFIINGF